VSLSRRVSRIRDQENVTMRMLIALVLLSCGSVEALAQDVRPAPVATIRPSQDAMRSRRLPPQARPIFSSALREGTRLTLPQIRCQEPAATARNGKTWISRHPAVFGALVGAGAGAVASGTMENELFCSGGDEDCFFHGGSRLLVGAGMGAGIGALIGWLGSL
jgi:hypothetical protein